MKIYIVFEFEAYEYDEVVRIYRTEEQAKRRVETMNKNGGHTEGLYHHYFHYLEYEVEEDTNES